MKDTSFQESNNIEDIAILLGLDKGAFAHGLSRMKTGPATDI